jgi:hypothetical protein
MAVLPGFAASELAYRQATLACFESLCVSPSKKVLLAQVPGQGLFPVHGSDDRKCYEGYSCSVHAGSFFA